MLANNSFSFVEIATCVNFILLVGGLLFLRARPILKKRRMQEDSSENIQQLKDLSGYLEQVESDFSNFFLLSDDFLCLANDAGYFVKVNPAATKILGWSKEELLSRPITDFIHPDDLNTTRQIIAELKSRNVFRFRNRLRSKDQGYKSISWSATPYNSDGITYSIGRDVTELPS